MNPPQRADAENSKVELRPRVLIADDEETIAETLRLILIQHGFEAIAVYGGDPAVQRAQDWQPDLFLSDVMMPDMNGIEAAIRITSAVPGCKVILISGKAVTENLLSDARRRGYDFELIFKPVHPTELLQILRMALDPRCS